MNMRCFYRPDFYRTLFNETLGRIFLLKYTAKPFKRLTDFFKHSAQFSKQSVELLKP